MILLYCQLFCVRQRSMHACWKVVEFARQTQTQNNCKKCSNSFFAISLQYVTCDIVTQVISQVFIRDYVQVMNVE